jgi:hypothetical protein
MESDQYKAILAKVRRHAALVVEAAEDIDTRAMDLQIFELRELQQDLICMEIIAGMTDEEKAAMERADSGEAQ